MKDFEEDMVQLIFVDVFVFFVDFSPTLDSSTHYFTNSSGENVSVIILFSL